MNVFIIEGWKDDDRLREVYPQIKTFVTNGTKFSKPMRNRIKKWLDKGCNVYILSDPDEAGYQLARMIWAFYPDLERIQVDPTRASYLRGIKTKYGVEFMGYSYIRELLGKYMEEEEK